MPFHNFYIALRVVGRPGHWLVLMIVPIANIVVYVIVAMDMAKAFQRDGGFAVILIVLPFVGYPMLAFSNATYLGPLRTRTRCPVRRRPAGRTRRRLGAIRPSRHTRLSRRTHRAAEPGETRA